MRIHPISQGIYIAIWVGLSTGVQLPAQDAPPGPPPLPPPPARTRPAFRPVPTQGAPANRSAATGVPSVPVPLHRPPPFTAVVNPSTPPPNPVTNPGALVFDTEQKEYSAKQGEAMANFTFTLTNVSSSEVLVNRVTTSCGCTVAKLPEQPWHVAPGTNGPINVTVDLRGKSGMIMKSVTVDSTAGMKSLLVKINIPAPQPIAAVSANNMNRTRNIALAQADRQAVFKSDCAECHVKPAIGKLGKELYAGACAICHEAEHRATMVPDLHLLRHPDTREYWTQITAEGKLNSLMPAFAQKSGGFLTDQQITSLVDYLTTDYPNDTNAFHHVAGDPLAGNQFRPVAQTNTHAAATVLGPFEIK